MSKNKTFIHKFISLYQPSLSLYKLLKTILTKCEHVSDFVILISLKRDGVNPFIFQKKISVIVRMRKMLYFFQHCLYFVIPISLKREGIIL